MASELILDRDFGIQVLSEDLLGAGGLLKYNVALLHGRGRNRYEGPGRPGYLIVGRLVVLPLATSTPRKKAIWNASRTPALPSARAPPTTAGHDELRARTKPTSRSR